MSPRHVARRNTRSVTVRRKTMLGLTALAAAVLGVGYQGGLPMTASAADGTTDVRTDAPGATPTSATGDDSDELDEAAVPEEAQRHRKHRPGPTRTHRPRPTRTGTPCRTVTKTVTTTTTVTVTTSPTTDDPYPTPTTTDPYPPYPTTDTPDPEPTTSTTTDTPTPEPTTTTPCPTPTTTTDTPEPLPTTTTTTTTTPPAPVPVPTTTTTTRPAGQYKDGSYTGPVVTTKYGPVQVGITVSGGRITKADAVKHPTGGFSDTVNGMAVPKLNAEVLAAQSAQIDAVSGATYTSPAYKTSLQAAIDQARA